MKTIDDVLADARGELPILRKHGQQQLADAIERLCDEFAEAAAPFREWLSETEAMLRSDKSAAWLRQRFASWERQGLARWNPRRPKERQYLRVVIPQAINLEAIRADAAREAARRTA